MICNRSKIVFGLFALVFSFFVFSSSANAVSDVTYTFDSSNPASFTYFCYNNEVTINVNCFDYSYMKIDLTGTWSNPPAWNMNPKFSFNFSGSTNYLYELYFYPVGSYILTLPSDASYTSIFLSSVSYGNNLPSDYSLTVTLTNSISASDPTGSISITENGTYDVSSYATAEVNVPPSTVEGDYHQDLVDIKTGIYVCAAVLLVLYFFYCIYRIIIKGGSL